MGNETFELIADALPVNCSIKYSVTDSHANIYPLPNGVVEIRRYQFSRVMVRFKQGYGNDKVSTYEATVARLDGKIWVTSDWTGNATAEPPTEYNLTLQIPHNGTYDHAVFTKSHDTLTTISFSLTLSSSLPIRGVIGVLPAGYRPKRQEYILCYVQDILGGGTLANETYPAVIQTNGNIEYYGNTIPVGYRIAADKSFYAAT